MIALAFIGQMSRLGAAFYAFALILLSVLVFVGVVTFLSLVQSSLEDIAFAHRIALLRDLYLRLSPEPEPYVLAGVALAAAGVHPLTLPVAIGALVGAGALNLQHCHHRPARDAYTPDGVDRAAIFTPSPSQFDTA